jgi:hypothetical protein
MDKCLALYELLTVQQQLWLDLKTRKMRQHLMLL